MATNDEIREQEDRQMAHYKSLTPDEQADRERSLMDKARAEGYKEGQKDAAKEIFDFEDYWSENIDEDNLSQEAVNSYYKAKKELWKKYNYKI